MLYFDVRYEKWRKKTGLDPETFICPKCGKDFQTTIPVITKDYFGFESPIHECGPEFTKIVYKPRSKDKLKIWERISDGF